MRVQVGNRNGLIMIKNIRLLRSIGRFHHVDAGKDIDLKRLTLCYADNTRGKTTLTAVLRSLALRDPAPIIERKRFGVSAEPHVVITTDRGSKAICYKDNSWSGSLPKIVVFDDTFIEENVYSGLTVSPRQRQHLHDLILGPQAVQLQKRLDEAVEKIESLNSEIRGLESFLKPYLMDSLSYEEFCALPNDSDIEKRISETERTIEAAKEQKSLSTTPGFAFMDLPDYDISSLKDILESTLDTLEQDALIRIQKHFNLIGNGSETWVERGMQFVSDMEPPYSACPFCGKSIDSSSLISHYQAYFSESYRILKEKISSTLRDARKRFGVNLRAEIEQQLRVIGERQQFWGRFCQIDPVELDTENLYQDCESALNAVVNLLKKKQSAPLEGMTLASEVREAIETYRKHIAFTNAIKGRLDAANRQIEELKTTIKESSISDLTRRLSRLSATKVRHTEEVSSICVSYQKKLCMKSKVEMSRKQIRKQLDQHRKNAFPNYQTKVNTYLEKFSAGYRLANLKPANLRSGSTTTYSAKVGLESIGVGKSPEGPEPSFGSVLSAGDRATLALAFFLTSLEELEEPEKTIVVIDDPISSLDAGRTLSTAQETRTLANRFNQVIVLSHNKGFLCAIAAHFDASAIAPIEILRVAKGSDLAKWNLKDESLTEHDIRHKAFQSFLQRGIGDKKDIAQSLRLHLESYLRVTCPEFMPVGQPLGHQFISNCHERVGCDSEILTASKLIELQMLMEFAGRYHHDTNPAWATENIVDAELQSFVKRTLKFTRA